MEKKAWPTDAKTARLLQVYPRFKAAPGSLRNTRAGADKPAPPWRAPVLEMKTPGYRSEAVFSGKEAVRVSCGVRRKWYASEGGKKSHCRRIFRRSSSRRICPEREPAQGWVCGLLPDSLAHIRHPASATQRPPVGSRLRASRCRHRLCRVALNGRPIQPDPPHRHPVFQGCADHGRAVGKRDRSATSRRRGAGGDTRLYCPARPFGIS